MRIIIRIIYLSMLLLIIFICGCTKVDKKSEKPEISLKKKIVENADPNCVDFVALWSSGDIFGFK